MTGYYLCSARLTPKEPHETRPYFLGHTLVQANTFEGACTIAVMWWQKHYYCTVTIECSSWRPHNLEGLPFITHADAM